MARNQRGNLTRCYKDLAINLRPHSWSSLCSRHFRAVVGFLSLMTFVYEPLRKNESHLLTLQPHISRELALGSSTFSKSTLRGHNQTYVYAVFLQEVYAVFLHPHGTRISFHAIPSVLCTTNSSLWKDASHVALPHLSRSRISIYTSRQVIPARSLKGVCTAFESPKGSSSSSGSSRVL